MYRTLKSELKEKAIKNILYRCKTTIINDRDFMTKPIAPLTPCIEGESVKALLKKINSEIMPFYVRCQPNHLGIQSECFSLVDQYALEHGGERINGWSLWEQPNLYIEAEFHAIWKSPEGDYLDLNYRPHKTENILFSPQPDLLYEEYPLTFN